MKDSKKPKKQPSPAAERFVAAMLKNLNSHEVIHGEAPEPKTKKE